MASDGQPAKIPAVSLVQGSQAPTKVVPQRSGNTLPPSGRSAAPPAALSLQAQVQLLNKYLNDSGKPDQFRVDPDSDDKLIQQVNPANGEVIAEFPASEFAALARSVGISGVVVDKLA
jgi:FlaG protein